MIDFAQISRPGGKSMARRFAMMSRAEIFASALCFPLLVASAAVHAQSTPSAAPGSPPALTAGRFGPIVYADLEKWNSSSGCSFAVFRGKDNIGLFDTQDPKRTAVFKIDGVLLFVPAGGGKDKASYWTGTVAGNKLRLIKGRIDPKFRNDGGSQGGEGRVTWAGPAGRGSIAVRWEEGC